MGAIDDDYETPQIEWRTERYWHTGRRTWVEAQVGELRFCKTPPSNPDGLIDQAKQDFKPQNKGRRSTLEGRVEAALEQLGPCDAERLAAHLTVQQSRIRKYVLDHPQRIEVLYRQSGRNIYAIRKENEA